MPAKHLAAPQILTEPTFGHLAWIVGPDKLRPALFWLLMPRPEKSFDLYRDRVKYNRDILSVNLQRLEILRLMFRAD